MEKCLLRSLTALLLLFGSQIYGQLTCFQDWRYVQPLRVTSFGAQQQTDFAVRFTVDTQSLISAGKLRPDAGDLRFVSSDCCSELPFWIMSGFNTPSTVIFIKIPLLSNPTHLSMLYGNPVASPPTHTIDSVLFSIGNDSTGADTLQPGLTVAFQTYNFPFNIRTVKWRIHSSDSGSVNFKLSNDTNMVLTSSPTFTIPSAPGFYEYIWESAASIGGHPGFHTSNNASIITHCMPSMPCPGSCGDMVYEPGNLGLFQPLDRDTCGAIPNVKIWYRKGAFFEPPVSLNGSEFDRNSYNLFVTADGNSTFCPGDSLRLYVGNQSGATYQWYHNGLDIPGAVDTSVFVKDSGAYGCVANFGFCKNVATDQLVAGPSAPIVDLGSDTLICTDGTYTLDAGPGYAAYLWSDSSTGQQLVVSNSGLYWVMVWDTNTCSYRDSIRITLQAPPDPVIAGGDTQSICAGDTLNLNAFDPDWYAYSWIPGGATSSDIDVDTAGVYSVVVYDSLYCSDTSNAVTVQVMPGPSVDIGLDQTICEGDSAMFDAGPGWSAVRWPGGVTGQTYAATTDGIYVVQVTDNNGCRGRDTASVTVNSRPDPYLGGDVQLCSGTTTVLAPTLAYSSYVWSTGATSQSIVAGAGMYQVTVTNANNCEGVSNLLTVSEYPGITAPVIAGGADGLSATTAPNYQWYLDGSPISGATGPNWVPQSSGDYYVIVTDPNGCGQDTSNTINIEMSNIPQIGSEDVPGGFSPNGDGINDRFEIVGIEFYTQSSLQVMNRWGNEVFRQSPYTNEWSGNGPGGRALPDGTYFYILDLGTEQDPLSGYIIINR